jgi:hypothetical protein
MLTGSTLRRVNDRPKKARLWPAALTWAAFLFVAGLLVLLTPFPFLPLGTLLLGTLTVFIAYRAEKAKTVTSLSYKGKLDEEVATRFAAVGEACRRLASSKNVCRLTDADNRVPRIGDVGAPPEREPASVGLLETPGIRADVPVWGIEAGGESIFFFPEGMLRYRDGRYEPLPYGSLAVRYSSARFFAEEPPPEDAEVVARIWRYARKDGTPDPRYAARNRQIPVVLWGVLEVSGPSGLDMRLMVSDRDAASRFAQAFAKAETGEEAHEERRRGAAPGRSPGDEARAALAEREARLGPARRVLGVPEGASLSEINATYRRMARTYHPDKVAHQATERREYAEERMKEINAAYSELKSLYYR